MRKSSGFINELCYVSLAYGLMDASKAVENGTCEPFGATKRGANYSVDKQIQRRMDTLKDELWQFMSKYADDRKRILTKSQKLFRLALSHITDAIQLDYLAVYILYIRFAPNERNKPLDDDFKWITEKEGSLFTIIDLLGKTEASNKEGEMYNLACKICEDM